MLRNILITGGAGFIGSNIALKLLAQGRKVTVLDNLTKQIHGENPEISQLYCSIKDKVNFINGSVTDRKLFEKVLENQDFRKHISGSKKNWLDTEDDKACDGILYYLKSLL